ncbi:MAG: TraR/DksA family transcriptional regulator [Marinobacterium sp.]|jgi:RNA polymerase-binding protein DksA|uniref:TraR/DksA family transcriptional regulator n=1 Tax=Marinobacterium sp. MBR-111 TaxID=3156463 RepID=UPI0033915657
MCLSVYDDDSPLAEIIIMSAVLNHHELESFSEELHELLTSMQEEVRDELHDIEHVRQLLRSIPPGQTELQATLEVARRLDLEHLRHHLDVIGRCNEALERINRGRYGSCCRCGETIELNRLRADPLTECCLTCQE